MGLVSEAVSGVGGVIRSGAWNEAAEMAGRGISRYFLIVPGAIVTC